MRSNFKDNFQKTRKQVMREEKKDIVRKDIRKNQVNKTYTDKHLFIGFLKLKKKLKRELKKMTAN